MVEEEIIVGGNGSHQAVLKSGPKKPKLENVTLAQWCVANNAILYRLISESKLNPNDMLDYIYYSCGKFPGDFSSQIIFVRIGVASELGASPPASPSAFNNHNFFEFD